MATCSSILAWRIPWTEEPGRLQSMELGCKESDRTECLTCIHNSSKIELQRLGPTLYKGERETEDHT